MQPIHAANEEMNRIGRDAEKNLKKAKDNRIIGMLAGIFIIGTIVYAFWYDWVNPRIRDITISEEQVISSTFLCPGDMLLTKIRLQIEGEGPLVQDDSVQGIDPSRVLIYSDPLRAPVIGPIDETKLVSWRVPTLYFDYQTGNTVSFPPGTYLHIVSVSSTGRSALSDTKSVSFTVGTGEDCGN